MGASRVKPKAVTIHIRKPDELLKQALSKYKGIVNSSLKIPEKEDAAVPYLQGVDFKAEFRKVKLKETGMGPAEYNSPAFKKAKVTPETECFYLSLVRHNNVRFDGKDHNSSYMVHHLAYPVTLVKNKVPETQIKYDMYTSMLEFLMVYGIEWIEHAMQNSSKRHVKKAGENVEKSVKELEQLADTIGTDESPEKSV